MQELYPLLEQGVNRGVAEHEALSHRLVAFVGALGALTGAVIYAIITEGKGEGGGAKGGSGGG